MLLKGKTESTTRVVGPRVLLTNLRQSVLPVITGPDTHEHGKVIVADASQRVLTY